MCLAPGTLTSAQSRKHCSAALLSFSACTCTPHRQAGLLQVCPNQGRKPSRWGDTQPTGSDHVPLTTHRHHASRSRAMFLGYRRTLLTTDEGCDKGV